MATKQSRELAKGWNVLASSARSVSDRPLIRTVVIFPPDENWNDFKHRTLAKFEVWDRDLVLKGNLHIGMIGNDLAPYEIIQSAPSHLLHLDERSFRSDQQIYTLLPDMQAYRYVFEILGIADGRALLRSLHDLVEAREQRPVPSWVAIAMRSEQFRLSFMRNSEAFFAFHNASGLFNGEGESFDAVSTELHLNFKLDLFENEHAFRFTFDPSSPLPKRIAVIIGENGVGKSQAMRKIVTSVTSGSKAFRGVGNSRPTISRILALSTPGEAAFTFPGSNSRSSRVDYRLVSLGRSGKGTKRGGLGEIAVRLARSTESLGQAKRWEIFLDAVSKVVPANEIGLKTTRTDLQGGPVSHIGRYVALSSLRRGGEQDRLDKWSTIDAKSDPIRLVDGKAYPFSSGQLIFLRFVAQACLHIENGTLVLLDEPETHLHPNLISEFLVLLDDLLRISGSVAIMSTHSVYFVREVPSSQVHVVHRINGTQVEIAKPRLRTFGASVSSISMFVFDDEINNRLLERVVEQLPTTPAGRKEFIKSIEEDLSDEIIMELHGERSR